jgi:hypothetical protein
MTKYVAATPRCLFAILPALIPLFIIYRWGVDIHFWDEWDPGLAGFFIKAHNGRVTLADFFAQHNEHRPAVPRLIFLVLNSLTHWNNFAYLTTTWLVVVVASFAILLLLRRTFANTPQTWLIWFLCNLLIFSPNQDQTWLWGMGLQNVLPTTLFLFALVVVLSGISPWPKLVVAGLLCLAATFSSGSGFLTWPLVAILLAHQKLWRQLFVLAIASALIALSYFHHYSSPTFGGVTGDHGTPSQLVGFFLAFLGNVFSTALPHVGQTVSIACGSVVVALFLASCGYYSCAWRNRPAEIRDQLLPWLLVGGFALLSDLLAAHGRAGFGIQQAMETRYVCASLYLAVALVAIVPLISQYLRPGYVPSILGCILFVLILMSHPGAMAACQKWNDSQRGVKAAVLLIPVLPNNPQLDKVFPSPDILVREAEDLNQMGYIRPPLITSPDANLISATDSASRGKFVAAVRSPEGVKLIGWAIDPSHHCTADGVFLTVQTPQNKSIIFQMAEMGVRAQLVVDQFHDSRYLYSGWSALIPTQALPSTPLNIRAWALDTVTGKAYLLDGNCVLQR